MLAWSGRLTKALMNDSRSIIWWMIRDGLRREAMMGDGWNWNGLEMSIK